MAPDVEEMKFLATALRMGAAFETVDKLAAEWIEGGWRNLNPKDLEEDQKREWYDVSDSWERAVKALESKVSRFEKETGEKLYSVGRQSPILRYERIVDSMGVQGKLFVGLNSPQAKGYRIVTLNYPVWFEDLMKENPDVFYSENMSEGAIYGLVTGERVSEEQMGILRSNFLDDLEEAGVPVYEKRGGIEIHFAKQEFLSRLDKAVDRRLPFDTNVLRVDALVQQIKREHSLAIPARKEIAVGPPISPIRAAVPVMAPEAKKKLEDWYVLYAPQLKKYVFNYLYRSSWDTKDFSTFQEVHDFVSKGEGNLYLHAYRGIEPVQWSYPVDMTPFQLTPDTRWENEGIFYHLQQPRWTGLMWIWRISTWQREGMIDRSREVEASESELRNNKFGFIKPYTPQPAAEKETPEEKEVLVSFREMFKVGPPEPPLKVGDEFYTKYNEYYGVIKNITPMLEKDQTPVYHVELPDHTIKKLHYSYVSAEEMKIKRIEEKPKVSIEEKIDKHFSSTAAKPMPVSFFTIDREVKAYSSHGAWSTLGKIRELEEERGNEFPKLPEYTPNTTALWVCFDKRMALRYLEDADQWDRLESDSPLTPEDEERMNDIAEVTLNPSDIVAFTDFDRGYLILRPQLAAVKPEPKFSKDDKVVFRGETFTVLSREFDNGVWRYKLREPPVFLMPSEEEIELALGEKEKEEEKEIEKEEMKGLEIPQEPDQTVYVVILVSGGVAADEKGKMKIQTPEFTVEATTKEEFAKYGDFNDQMWLRPIAGIYGVPMLDELLKDGEVEYDAVEDNAITWGNDWDAIREALADNPPPFNKYAKFIIKWRPEDLHWTRTAADTHDVYHYKYTVDELKEKSKHELQVIAKVKDLSTSGEEGELIDRIAGAVQPAAAAPAAKWTRGMPITDDHVEQAKEDALTHVADEYVARLALATYQQKGKDEAIKVLRQTISSWGQGGPDEPSVSGTPKGILVENDVMNPTDTRLISYADLLDYLLRRGVKEAERVEPPFAPKFNIGDVIREKTSKELYKVLAVYPHHAKPAEEWLYTLEHVDPKLQAAWGNAENMMDWNMELAERAPAKSAADLLAEEALKEIAEDALKELRRL